MSVRSEMASKIKDIEKRIHQSETGLSTAEQEKRELKFVIHKLPETENENLLSKVTNLLCDGMGVESVTVEQAERKTSRRQGVSGLVIVKCRSAEDKTTIFKNKRKLNSSTNYKTVTVDHDKPYTQRIQESNLRTIAAAIGKDKVFVRGNRVVKSQTDQHRT